MQAFTAEQESPLLLQHEFHLVQTAPVAPDMDNFSLKANSITREVIAVMEIEDGAVLEMIIKLPTSSPLRRAEVACRRRVSPCFDFCSSSEAEGAAGRSMGCCVTYKACGMPLSA